LKRLAGAKLVKQPVLFSSSIIEMSRLWRAGRADQGERGACNESDRMQRMMTQRPNDVRVCSPMVPRKFTGTTALKTASRTGRNVLTVLFQEQSHGFARLDATYATDFLMIGGCVRSPSAQPPRFIHCSPCTFDL
jgi:hypothetical protein